MLPARCRRSRFGKRWNRRLGRLFGDTDAHANKLRRPTADYCAADRAAADAVCHAGISGTPLEPGPARRTGTPGGTGIPDVPGGGYIPPHTDYGD